MQSSLWRDYVHFLQIQIFFSAKSLTGKKEFSFWVWIDMAIIGMETSRTDFFFQAMAPP